MEYKFRKRPIVIEAFQITRERRENNVDWPEWLHEAWNKQSNEIGSVYQTIPGTENGSLSVRSIEGEESISWDSWVIQGIKGELYPCSDDIFKLTYERVGCDTAR